MVAVVDEEMLGMILSLCSLRRESRFMVVVRSLCRLCSVLFERNVDGCAHSLLQCKARRFCLVRKSRVQFLHAVFGFFLMFKVPRNGTLSARLQESNGRVMMFKK